MKKFVLIVLCFSGCASNKSNVRVVELPPQAYPQQVYQQYPYPQQVYPQNNLYPRMTTSVEAKAIVDPYSDKPLDHIEIVLGARKNW